MADAVYDVLVSKAGAVDDESNRDQFRRFFWDQRYDYREYRFIGSLGFGGKLWATRHGVYVNCYPEDLTDARAETIRRTNAALDALFVPEEAPR